MLSFLYVYSDHSVLECYNLFSGVELSMRSFFVIIIIIISQINNILITAGNLVHLQLHCLSGYRGALCKVCDITDRFLTV